MAQNTWSLPAATDDFIDCRTDYNNALNNLATNHAGNSAPSVIHDRMWWYDEDDDIMKLEDGEGGWISLLQGEADGGMLRLDGSGVMTGDLDMGSNDIILDDDGDSKIVCDTDDELSIELGGAEEYLFDATELNMNDNRIKDPKNDATLSVGSWTKRIIFDIDGTEYACKAYALS